jgi:hypothetical protein
VGDGLADFLGLPKERIRHAHVKGRHDEIERVKVVLECFRAGSIGRPPPGMSLLGAEGPEEQSRRNVPNEGTATVLKEFRNQHASECAKVETSLTVRA